MKKNQKWKKENLFLVGHIKGEKKREEKAM